MTDTFGSRLEKPLAFTCDAALDSLSELRPLDLSRDRVLSNKIPLHCTSCHPPYMEFSRDAALSSIPAPHLLKQEQLQLADASFRDQQHQQLGVW